MKIKRCRVILPDKSDNISKFNNYKDKVPFVVYTDIDSLLEPITNNQMNVSTYQKHIPISVAYYVQ